MTFKKAKKKLKFW